MIDFVKFQFRGEEKNIFERLIKNKQENFFQKFGDRNQILATSSGEIIDYPIWLRIQNIKIKISHKTSTIEGSLHKFHNISFDLGDHNYNDFSYFKIIESINILNTHFNDLSNGVLTSLEFGFNITPSTAVLDIIKNRIHRHNDCNNIEESFKFSKVYKQFRYFDYDFKVYDKGRMYQAEFRTTPNILRIELRLRGKELRRLEIFHLSDLSSKQNLRKIFQQFRRRFEELIIIDPIPKNINGNERNLIYDYKHLDFWNKYLGRNFHSQAKYRLKTKVEELIKLYELDKSKKEIRSLLLKKYLFLINN